MKKMFALAFASLMIVSCGKKDIDDDETNIDTVDPVGEVTDDTDTSPTRVTSVTLINDYIWEGLNQYYYWQDQVPSLSDDQTTDVTSYLGLLNSEDTPEDFFYSLNHEDDRFSWIQDDYEELENQLDGISANNGMNFIIYRRNSENDNLIGVVTYVLPDSNAATQGVQRGDLFTSVNGENLTIANYRGLLYGEAMTYTIDLVNYDPVSDSSSPRNISITLTKEENFQENPVHKQIVIDVNDRRVGYLMYNKFVGEVDNNDDGNVDEDFNQTLIDIFSGFQNLNIQDLVLDLRYNGGGSVRTCTYLASMITGQFTGEIFAQQRWNTKLMNYINAVNSDSDSSNDFNIDNRFVSSATNNRTLPGLNLNRIYVITSNRSASASELLINGLASHINVIQVGTTTYGKNVGSITLYDYVDNQAPFDSINQDHTYAMQPIVLKIANSAGYADYANGIPPADAATTMPNLTYIEARESIANYGILGDPYEPLLATALNHITGNSDRPSELLPMLDEAKLPAKITDQYRLNIDDFPKIPLKKLR